MSVRLPSGDSYVPQVEKEHRWLPVLRGQVPVAIPEPLAKGEPGAGYTRPWSIYRWIDGETVSVNSVSDRVQFAHDLAGFLNALYRCDASAGPAAGPHSFSRGGPVSTWDTQTRALLSRSEGQLDVRGALDVWEAALAAVSLAQAPVWVHGDVTGSNLLVRQGRLCAVLDFGCSAVGDPACDTTIAWTLFEGESRDLFMSELAVDEATWARGRGWALWKALLEVVGEMTTPGRAVRASVRFGWRAHPREIIADLIAD
jgi:aminoglycoside phosphotransferase (APT) family kinase protein